MYLTKDEEAILNGELGNSYALAMKVLTVVGDALKAERLIPVVHTHVSGVSYFNIGDAGVEFIESLAAGNAKFQVFTTANPYAVVTDTPYGGLPGDLISKQMRVINSLKLMGATTFTCAPYYVRRPSYGEHLAWAESNAVLYANSLLGARSNREGGPLALLEGLVGRTYAAGAHLDEGRIPTCAVSVKVDQGVKLSDLSLLGLMVGELCPDSIPFVEGLEGLTENEAKTFLAAFGSTSNSPMVVFNKLTPDSKELLANSDFKERFSVDENSLKSIYSEIREGVSGESVVYFIGCPHLSLDEVLSVINYVKSKGSGGLEGRELWLGVSEDLQLDKGLLDSLAGLGVRLIRGMCPVTTKLNMLGVRYVVTDSGKALHYMPKLAGVKVIIKDRPEILKEFLRR